MSAYAVSVQELQWARIVLLLLFGAAFFLYMWNVGRMWAGRSRASNLLATSFLGLIGYVAVGQIKGTAYGVPVDALSYFGGVVAVVIIVALVWLQHGGRRHEEA